MASQDEMDEKDYMDLNGQKRQLNGEMICLFDKFP